ncbi:hypothetical protein B0J13DRAFT_532630 [Dactylonectria estremocensis]|uniref:Uncharacterized protein n=1 Tax=Dactylonectria estremocensis TaxID=1079267 RepID=A0A9P9DG62_9HYPO|nr:hypothetical protein B0J13DRAFT_532630 [Dactylonectria estremocensis]
MIPDGNTWIVVQGQELKVLCQIALKCVQTSSVLEIILLIGLPTCGSKGRTAEVLLRLTELGGNNFGNIIGTVVVDSLSRCGLVPNYNVTHSLGATTFGNWKPGEKITQVTDSQVWEYEPPGDESDLTGYVMSVSGCSTSRAALLVHALIAMVHTMLVALRSKTSGAWDSILELVTLARMLTPPPKLLLANACAGI